jgi:hypothetical protein
VKPTVRPPVPEDPPFEITGEAGFDAAGTWIIRVTARFRDGTAPAEGTDLYAEAQLGALLAIMKAGQEGRRLGATQVRVFLDLGDGPRMIVPGDYMTAH